MPATESKWLRFQMGCKRFSFTCHEAPTVKPLASNAELYNYLRRLERALQDRGRTDLADSLAFAASQAASLSTEFLGEARIALRRVISAEEGLLPKQELEELIAVLKQLDDA